MTKLLVSVLLCGLACAMTTEAQYTQNNQTNVVTGVVNWNHDYAVGSNTVGNVLIVKTGGRLSDGKGFVGCLESSGANSVLVTGKDSSWINNNSVCIGYRSAGNGLVIRDGGTVVSTFRPNPDEAKQGWDAGWIGFWSDKNTAVVTGAGSVWSNKAFCVGEWGKDNSLTIVDGGRLYSAEAWIGRDPGADRNTALVSGTGSTWLNSGSLSVGSHGFDCRLDIKDGGNVAAASVTIGETYAPMRGNTPSGCNVLELKGGVLTVTNKAGNARLTLGDTPARFIINGGTARVDQVVVNPGQLALYAQHGPNMVVFNAGILETRSITVAKNVFTVGDRKNMANLHLVGGTHVFAEGLHISTNAMLTGNATITGNVLNEGTILLENGESVFNSELTNNGRIELADTASAVFKGPVVNDGVIKVPKGKVNFAKGVKGNGKVVEK